MQAWPHSESCTVSVCRRCWFQRSFPWWWRRRGAGKGQQPADSVQSRRRHDMTNAAHASGDGWMKPVRIVMTFSLCSRPPQLACINGIVYSSHGLYRYKPSISSKVKALGTPLYKVPQWHGPIGLRIFGLRVWGMPVDSLLLGQLSKLVSRNL